MRTTTRCAPPRQCRACAEVSHDASWGAVLGGIDLEATHASKQEASGYTGIPVGDAKTWLDVGAWTQARFVLADRMTLKPGLRIDNYGLTGETVVDPRLDVHLRLTDHLTMVQAIGRYHQPPTVADVDPRGGNPDLKSSYSDQFSLGVTSELRRIEASAVG